MTNYREILRLYSQGISQRSIAASCACSRNTVAKVLNRAQELDLSWPLQEGMSDAELRKLFSLEAKIASLRKRPDCEHIHREMAKSGVTLSLYGTNTVKTVGQAEMWLRGYFFRKVMKLTGQAKLLKIYVGEAIQHKGKNVAQLIVDLLKENRIAGATVTRGVMGYGWDAKIRGTKVLELSADLPLVIEAVDTTENIEIILPRVLEILPRGLCFTVDVTVHFSGVKKKT